MCLWNWIRGFGRDGGFTPISARAHGTAALSRSGTRGSDAGESASAFAYVYYATFALAATALTFVLSTNV
jgi:hypothetical protein